MMLVISLQTEVMTEQGTKKGKRILYIFVFIVFLYGIGLTAYHRHLDSLPQDYTVVDISVIQSQSFRSKRSHFSMTKIG
jgi:hypothetical protein